MIYNVCDLDVQAPGADPGSFEGGSNQDEHIPHKIKLNKL